MSIRNSLTKESLTKGKLENGIVSKGEIEEENFEIDDVVFLDDDGTLEQAYDKEDE